MLGLFTSKKAFSIMICISIGEVHETRSQCQKSNILRRWTKGEKGEGININNWIYSQMFSDYFSTSIQILLGTRGQCLRSNTWWQQTKGERGRPPWASFAHQIILQPCIVWSILLSTFTDLNEYCQKIVVEAESLLITSFLFAGNSFLLNGKATSSQATSHTLCFQSTNVPSSE